ncbi:MAG: TonB family protein [Deltaproteobacteria bacterium]|nr:MAG: TonB family protein [Deltaproteobacteria bacterium]
MRVLMTALMLSLSPAFAAGSPVLDELRPPAAAALDHRREVDWFQMQTSEVHRRWMESLHRLPSPTVQAAEGSRARVDVRIDGKGHVVGAAVGRSTGSATIDQELLDALEGAVLAPPPESLPDEQGIVRFSVYFDVTARVDRPEDEESPVDA